MGFAKQQTSTSLRALSPLFPLHGLDYYDHNHNLCKHTYTTEIDESGNPGSRRRHLGTQTRTGFETRFHVNEFVATVYADALDAYDVVIGTSLLSRVSTPPEWQPTSLLANEKPTTAAVDGSNERPTVTLPVIAPSTTKGTFTSSRPPEVSLRDSWMFYATVLAVDLVLGITVGMYCLPHFKLAARCLHYRPRAVAPQLIYR